jgi:deferrochelatase/peroxidase EfeB
LPGQGRPIKAGEFILGYPGEAGVPLPMPRPDVLGRNGTFVGLRKYQSRVATFNRFLREHAGTEQERELLAAKLVGRWRSGAPLTLTPTQDDPALGADPRRNDDFTYADDPRGHQVPLGSHMRRMNPTNVTRTSGCRRTGRRSPSRKIRSDAAHTASRRSTCSAAASTSSCPPYPP